MIERLAHEHSVRIHGRLRARVGRKDSLLTRKEAHVKDEEKEKE